jgi:hypothetical protein
VVFSYNPSSPWAGHLLKSFWKGEASLRKTLEVKVFYISSEAIGLTLFSGKTVVNSPLDDSNKYSFQV